MKKIEIPKKLSRPRIYPELYNMAIGQTVDYEINKANKVRPLLVRIAKVQSKKFVTRVVEEGLLRVWRVEVEPDEIPEHVTNLRGNKNDIHV
jgi:hypothetical protein